MASTFFGLTIAYSGLQAANTSLTITGHNVSNINTKGYTKQQAGTQAADALRTHTTYGAIGSGVVVTEISQIRDSYYDVKYRNNMANYGQYSVKESYMGQIVNLDTSEEDMGNNVSNFSVRINGQTLVSSYSYNTLETVARTDKKNYSDAEGLYDVQWNSGQKFDMYSTSLSGHLKGLIDIRDGNNGEHENIETDDDGNNVTDSDGNLVLTTAPAADKTVSYKGVPYYQAQLNEFAKIFSDAVNKIMKSGYTSDGSSKGISLFVTQPNTTVMSAGNITVNPELLKNADLLAIKKEQNDGESDAKIMEELNKLQSEKIFAGGTGSYFLESIVSDMSIDSQKAVNLYKNYTDLKTSIHNQRLSIMGVDTDEEAMDMIKYQQAYNLNSKMMSVMNQIYDKLINQTGI